ncbi:ABC transporter permease [Desulfococcaceae bacterium HSG9]|nr:ABC transporter permease [Desulfococcaceae bacterium HSG9]
MTISMNTAQETNPCSHRKKILIKAPSSMFKLNISEIWEYRELLSMFVWRDIAVRYKQSLIGIGWAVIQPVMTMIIFSLIFGYLAKLPSEGIPYPIYTFCALLPWNYFARSLTDSSDSLVSSANLVTKVYFPRLILPLSKVLAGFIDFTIAFVILLALMVWYQIAPSYGIFLLPAFMLIAILTAFGIGLWLTALNVKYRDIKFVVPFITQLWMYTSPVAYSTSLIPEKWQWLYGLNPMVGVIEGFRWALLSKGAPDPVMMSVSTVIVLIILVGGIYYFRKTEQTFSDII